MWGLDENNGGVEIGLSLEDLIKSQSPNDTQKAAL